MGSDTQTIAVENLRPGESLVLRGVRSRRAVEAVKVLLRNPRRELDVGGARSRARAARRARTRP